MDAEEPGGRRKFVALLVGIDEEVVAAESSRLAMMAISGSMIEHSVKLLRR